MNTVQYLSPNKNILQQSNNNVPAELKPDLKVIEKVPKRRRTSLETENRFEVVKGDNRSVASKLRKVRLDVSSQKVVQYPGRYNPTSSDETGEEEDEELEEEDEYEEFEEEEDRKGRKQTERPIIPNYVTKNDKVQYRKRRKSRAEELSSQGPRDVKPQVSNSIAKRNARERNRVRLVNQGFASLRRRIPDYISEMYSEEKKKKNAKKVSKVETLRMALGYIRHLTEMLELRSTEPQEWFRINQKTEDASSWRNAGNSSTGYPSPVDTEYQQSPSIYGNGDRAFYEYDLELETVKDLSVNAEEKDALLLGAGSYPVKEETDFLVEDSSFAKDSKESLLLNESSFAVNVGCCYELVDVKQEILDADVGEPDMLDEVDGSEPEKTGVLPSITESFPKKNLRIFYGSPNFLSGTSAFHV